MFTSAQVLAALLVPWALAMSGALVLRRRGGDVRALGVLTALAAAAGHAAAAWAVGDALLPPVRGWHWNIVGAVAVAVACWSAGRWRGLVLAVAAAGVVGGITLPLAGCSAGLRGAGMVVAALAVALSSWSAPTAVTGWWSWCVLGGVAGAAALANGLSGSKDLALLAGTVPMALVGVAVVARRAPERAVVTALVVGHVALGAGYAEVAPLQAVLLMAALPAGAMASWVPGRGGAVAQVVLPLAIALGVVAWAAWGLLTAEAAPY